MIEKVVRIVRMEDHDEIAQNLEYWLSRPEYERVEAVEILRRQIHGDSARLQRVGRVIKQTSG